MGYEHTRRTVTDEDRREFLKVLGVTGAAAAGGVTLSGVHEEMSASATEELAPIGEAIAGDLAGELEASLISGQQSAIAEATAALPAVLERGFPEEGPREEFTAVAEAGRPLYNHLETAGFFESTTEHLPAFEPSYLTSAINVVAGSETLTTTFDEFEFVAGEQIDVLAAIVGNASELDDHWVATDQIPRAELEYGEYVPPMMKSAAGGVLLWLEDLDLHLWNQEVLLTEEIITDAVWYGQAMAAGFQLMAEGAKAIAAEDAALSNEELGGVLSTGFAVQAISQELLPTDVYWITDEMRGDRRTDLARVTR